MRLLLDANMSPKTASFLQGDYFFDVTSLIAANLGSLPDREVIKKATDEKRIIITLDLDFGKLYHETQVNPAFGVIIVRTNNQQRKHVEELLANSFNTKFLQQTFTANPHALVVIEDTVIRKIL